VGDEGVYAPPLTNTREALDAMMAAISKARYTESEIKLGIDAASSTFFENESALYQIDGKKYTSEELEDFYADLADSYPRGPLRTRLTRRPSRIFGRSRRGWVAGSR
jgi:enolase